MCRHRVGHDAVQIHSCDSLVVHLVFESSFKAAIVVLILVHIVLIVPSVPIRIQASLFLEYLFGKQVNAEHSVS